MHRYRSQTCGQLRANNVGETARLSGWVHRVRDHGGCCLLTCVTITASRSVLLIRILRHLSLPKLFAQSGVFVLMET